MNEQMDEWIMYKNVHDEALVYLFHVFLFSFTRSYFLAMLEYPITVSR